MCTHNSRAVVVARFILSILDPPFLDTGREHRQDIERCEFFLKRDFELSQQSCKIKHKELFFVDSMSHLTCPCSSNAMTTTAAP